jgi:hypothetical protein
MLISKLQIKEWLDNPLTRAYLKVVLKKKDQENSELLNSEDCGIKDAITKGKIKALEEILDIETFLEGEDDEEN